MYCPEVQVVLALRIPLVVVTVLLVNLIMMKRTVIDWVIEIGPSLLE